MLPMLELLDQLTPQVPATLHVDDLLLQSASSAASTAAGEAGHRALSEMSMFFGWTGAGSPSAAA